MKNPSSGVELFHADRRMCRFADQIVFIVAFRKFCENALKNQLVNAVEGNNRCLLSEQYETRKYTVWAESGLFVKLYLVVQLCYKNQSVNIVQ